MVGTDLVLGSVPAVGSRMGAGMVGGPGGRASWGPRPPGTGGRAWVPAGSGLDLVPCSGLSVSLALLGKVWVLGLGRKAACGGRTCPGPEALRQASGSAEVARGQATEGLSGGGGGRANFLTGYRAGAEGREQSARVRESHHASARRPPHAHTAPGGPETFKQDPRAGPAGQAGVGVGAFAIKENK